MHFSILITTKNRLSQLQLTLKKIEDFINRDDVECLVYDDGSDDNTFNFIKANYPEIKIFKNLKSKGLIFCRNILLSKTKSKYAITIDDDSHIVNLEAISKVPLYFNDNMNCAVLGCRIFWGLSLPENITTTEISLRVKSFVGCGHIWNMEKWHLIPKYPEWFEFYGEEDFAAFQLFKKGLQIHYFPKILVHHRVDIKSRKQNNDYLLRTRRSLRSGWYLYAMFCPKRLVLKKITYSIYAQFKNKIIKGDYRVAFALCQALLDLILNTPKLIRNRERLSIKEFEEFCNLPDTKIYWKP